MNISSILIFYFASFKLSVYFPPAVGLNDFSFALSSPASFPQTQNTKTCNRIFLITEKSFLFFALEKP
jgi:hypothetical protein